MHLLSASLQIAFEIGDFFETSKHQKQIFKLQLDTCLITLGPTLIFTASVYPRDRLNRTKKKKKNIPAKKCCSLDDLRLVSSFAHQSWKSYIILQAYYWSYIKDKVSHPQKYNNILHINGQAVRMSTLTFTHTHTQWKMYAKLLGFFDCRTAIKTNIDCKRWKRSSLKRSRIVLLIMGSLQVPLEWNGFQRLSAQLPDTSY